MATIRLERVPASGELKYGDTGTYIHDFRSEWELKSVAGLPGRAGDMWVEELGLPQLINKGWVVIDIWSSKVTILYKHDFEYSVITAEK
jgi:hypothetical protein